MAWVIYDSKGRVVKSDLVTSYQEYDEITTPSSPAADKLRLYAKDFSAKSGLFYVDDGGNEFWVADSIFRTIPFTSDAADWAVGVSGSGVTTLRPGRMTTDSGGATGVARISQSDSWMANTRGSAPNVINWGRRILLKLRFTVGTGGVNGISRIALGKTTAEASGDLAAAGIGIKVTTLALAGQVHSGAALTTTATLATLVAVQVYDLLIISRGSGTVEWFLDGVSIGTSAGGPTAAGTADNSCFRLESTSSATARHETLVFNAQIADLVA